MTLAGEAISGISELTPQQTETLLLQKALGYHNAGQAAAAAELCQRILAANPDQPQALLLLGLILGQGSEPATGAQLLARYLTLRPDDPIATYNLGMLHQQQGELPAALALFERALVLKPEFGPAHHGIGVVLRELDRLDDAVAAFERALALDPRDAVCHNNFGDLQRTQGKFADALESFDRALAIDPAFATAHCNRGIVLVGLGRHDDAIVALRQALALDPHLVRAHFEISEALEATWQPVEAHRHRIQAVRRNPLVITASTGGAPEARVLVLCSAGRGDVSVKYLLDPKRFEKIHLFLLAPGESPAEQPDLIARLPAFDIIFNAIADADRGAPYLPLAAELCAQHRRPVLNPPARIEPTRRDRIARHLGDIPGLVVPRTRYMTRARIAALATAGRPFAWPKLVRPAGMHGGEGLERIEQTAELVPYLDRMPFDAFFLTDFWDFRSADGNYRKYRFVFVDRVAFPYHLAISSEWRVHYWRADMDAAAWKADEEAQFLADPTRAFPGVHGETIQAIGRRLDLDYGGIDCAMLPDGRLIVFEANANMLVHMDGPEARRPYKERYVPRIFDAMTDLVMRRVRAAG
jgi:tetratricopeptide (TPR) repeat protein